MSPTPKNILVPVDGSEHAIHAVTYGAHLAVALQAELTVLYVVHATSAEAMGMRHLDHDSIEASLRAAAAPTLQRVAAALEQVEGLGPHGEIVRFGNPADEILTAVSRLGIDQVVMGSRGLNHLQEILLGSVSEKVVRRAPCPVTVVR